jgi:hypothetical protein
MSEKTSILPVDGGSETNPNPKHVGNNREFTT